MITERKHRALVLLGEGKTTREIMSELSVKEHTLKRWKENDEEFRKTWIALMKNLGRIYD